MPKGLQPGSKRRAAAGTNVDSVRRRQRIDPALRGCAAHGLSTADAINAASALSLMESVVLVTSHFYLDAQVAGAPLTPRLQRLMAKMNIDQSEEPLQKPFHREIRLTSAPTNGFHGMLDEDFQDFNRHVCGFDVATARQIRKNHLPGCYLIQHNNLLMEACRMFSERKAAQVAAWFLQQAGGRMPHLKLMKLMYLADRAALGEFGFSITGDRAVSMPHGLVLSMTLNLVNGDIESGDDGWESWISDRADHEVALRERPPGQESLDQISAADADVLARVWRQFGNMNKWQIRDYTHDHCAEWEDPQGSSKPIPFERIFTALGRSAEEAAWLAEQIAGEHRVGAVFAAL